MSAQASQAQRENLHKKIWAIADDLRGAVDGWDFKNYVLGAMFYRYISESLEAYVNDLEHEAGNPDFSYAELSDEEAIVAKDDLTNAKGFYIPPSQLFVNVVKHAHEQKETLNQTLTDVFATIMGSSSSTESEGDLKGLFDDFDVNNNKLGSTLLKRNETLIKLLEGVAEMEVGSVEDSHNDSFGDAYEYLMSMYASNAGKSGGEFFTPADVAVLLTKLGTVGKEKVRRAYDPACGSGSLLLKSIQVLGKDNVGGFYGQEKNVTTYNLCRINMWLHGIGFDNFDIACEDTLIKPQHWDAEPFDLIVSNPPYSIKWEGSDNPILINDERFAPAGVLAPKSKADLAFIMHSVAWLASDGAAAIVCFPGIMYRGGAEQKVRKYLIENNFIDAIIQLPSNLFFGTSIATCIMVLKKNKQDNTVTFIDASKEFIKVTNNNRLTDENIDKIVSWYTSHEELEHLVHIASLEELQENEYNLSVSTYVEQEDTREIIDIEKLNKDLETIVAKEAELRAAIDQIVKEIEVMA